MTAESPQVGKYDHWFDQSTGMNRVSKDNRTTFFIAGETAFASIGKDLQSYAQTGAEAYFLGWSFDQNVQMLSTPSPASIRQLLSDFAAVGGKVRAMLWKNSFGNYGPLCEAGVNLINALPKGQAILDSRTPLAGTHHQKVQALVSSDNNIPVAYCGGMDVFSDRIGPNALHDVHCRIDGPGANDLIAVFLERWNDHPAHGDDLPAKGDTIAPLDSDLVQVCRTYPQFQSKTLYAAFLNFASSRLASLLSTVGAPPPGDMTVDDALRYYNFYIPDRGVQQVWKAVKKAITEAKSFIYLEDQYLVNKWIGDALAQKLASADRNFRIVILTLHPNLNTDIEQLWQRRKALLSGLQAVDPGSTRWRVLCRRLNGPSPYVHSKTWIFDDELVITGSANADRRGYTYNSEVDIVVAGDYAGTRKSAFGATTVAQDLRCQLFAKHLLGKPVNYLTAAPALKLWFGSLGGTNVQAFNPSEKRGDPDKYTTALKQAATGKPSPKQELAAGLLNGINALWGNVDEAMWDLVEDPDALVSLPQT
jgi:phosphatidylserine/phosphatidylglycerophosphate/cardiolipin synthase-like enzyme